MGNPHPTKSKPCKIGRKHTGADSTRVRERKRRAKAITQAQNDAKDRKRRNKIAAYWRGEIDEFPT